MLLLRELTSSGTSMSPGITAMGGLRPKPSPVVRLFSFLVDRTSVAPTVRMGDEAWPIEMVPGNMSEIATIRRPEAPEACSPSADWVEVPLVQIAYGRSGDKGNDSNVGIIAREPDYLPYIHHALSVEAVADYFGHVMHGEVDRYDWPGIDAINFVLHESLAGGGIASLRNDPQGKTFAQMLLDFPVSVPPEVARDLV